ncbi:NUDIX hydrolase [Parasalinivibrio latis]|uniref:NUDIX domain-containing protein n=1 Tax=Parasalinivibrio latis TaxID=2952610 RepID=UPI0030E4B437
MTDGLAHKFPVSVKGVLDLGGRYPLLKNERDEWELPGGKLEPGEDLEECVTRETSEELGVAAYVVQELNNWLYPVNETEVVIVTYLLRTHETDPKLIISNEHKELKVFSFEEAKMLNMPTAYLRSLELAEAAR